MLLKCAGREGGGVQEPPSAGRGVLPRLAHCSSGHIPVWLGPEPNPDITLTGEGVMTFEPMELYQ